MEQERSNLWADITRRFFSYIFHKIFGIVRLQGGYGCHYEKNKMGNQSGTCSACGGSMCLDDAGDEWKNTDG